MKTNRIFFLIGAAAMLALNACALTSPTPAAPSATTMTFAQQVSAFDANAQTAIADFNANAGATIGAVNKVALAAGKSACGYVSEASGLYQAVKPGLIAAGAVSPGAAATEAAVTLGVTVGCALIDNADPNAPVTPAVAQAVASVVATVPQVKSLLAQDPVVATAATAPAAPPT